MVDTKIKSVANYSCRAMRGVKLRLNRCYAQSTITGESPASMHLRYGPDSRTTTSRNCFGCLQPVCQRYRFERNNAKTNINAVWPVLLSNDYGLVARDSNHDSILVMVEEEAHLPARQIEMQRAKEAGRQMTVCAGFAFVRNTSGSFHREFTHIEMHWPRTCIKAVLHRQAS